MYSSNGTRIWNCADPRWRDAIYSDSGALRTLSNAPDLTGSIPAVSPKNSYHTTIESVPETAPSCTASKCSFFVFVRTPLTQHWATPCS